MHCGVEFMGSDLGSETGCPLPQKADTGVVSWLRQIRVLARQLSSPRHAALYSGSDPDGIDKQTNK